VSPSAPSFSVRTDWTDEELWLAQWLRVLTPDEFRSRARDMANDESLWEYTVNAQRNSLRRRWESNTLEREIERQLGIRDEEVLPS
jgi:hypothetical protein